MTEPKRDQYGMTRIEEIVEALGRKYGWADCDECGGVGTTWGSDVCDTCRGSGLIPAHWVDEERQKPA